MGSIRKRGGVWHGDYRDPSGQRQRHSLYTRSKKVAQQRLRRAELGERIAPGSAPEKALAAAVDDMLSLKKETTAEAYRAKSGQLFRLLGKGRDIETLTAADVTAYITHRRGEGASAHTIHKELVVLRQALKEAQRRGEYNGDPRIVPSWTADYEPEDRWLTRAEYDTLVAGAPEHRKLWIVLQCQAGPNKGEMQRLTWEHVDLRAGWLRIPGTKRQSRWRRVPISAELREWLEAADRGAPLVAPWPRVSHELPALCESLGIERAGTNDLRRTFGSWLVQAGVPTLTVAHLMGNSVAMVERVYGRLSEQSYHDAIAALGRNQVTNASQSDE